MNKLINDKTELFFNIDSNDYPAGDNTSFDILFSIKNLEPNLELNFDDYISLSISNADGSYFDDSGITYNISIYEDISFFNKVYLVTITDIIDKISVSNDTYILEYSINSLLYKDSDTRKLKVRSVYGNIISYIYNDYSSDISRISQYTKDDNIIIDCEFSQNVSTT